MSTWNITGDAGVRSARLASYRRVLQQGNFESLSKPLVIDGTLSRDTGNTGFLNVLRPGLLLGKVTTGGKYAPAIIGIIAANVSSSGTTVTISPAQAVELVRRVGATGTLRLVGPPTTTGTVATFTETYSAVNTTTGAVTVSGLDADLVAGSFVAANDGSYQPMTLIDSDDVDWAVDVFDADGNGIDIPLSKIPISGVIDSAQILPAWPSVVPLQQWIEDQLNGKSSDTGKGAGNGHFTFAHAY